LSPVATAPTTSPDLLAAVLAESGLTALAARAGRAELRIEGPAALRPFVAATLARADVPVTLAVCATEREADDLVTALGELIGPDAVALLPSWETLPHERLSPRSDTVGRRIALLRRLDQGDRELRVVVAAVRSLIQPIAPGLGRLEPIDLAVGDTHDFDELLSRLVELAYTRVDMVTVRGEFAVRGGIVDVFPPTAEHPVRLEMWGDEVSELRQFAVADQRSIDAVERLHAPPCRELLLTEPVRARAAELAAEHGANQQLVELLEKLAQGIPVEGMESLIPALCGNDLDLLTDLLPDGAHVLIVDPERLRTRAADLVRTGQEFLEASWLAAAAGRLDDSAAGTHAKAPIDLGASAYRGLTEVAEHALATGRRWWTLSPFTSDEDVDPQTVRPGFHAAEAYRGDTARALTDLRKHTESGGSAVLMLAGAGTAKRALEQLADAEVPARLADGTDTVGRGVVTVTQGLLTEGFAVPELGLLVLTEADLTGNRALAATPKLATRRRNAVQLETLTPGDYVVHSQHGIGRFVEMRERNVGGATREYLVLEYASSKRGQPADRLFVPTDQLDEISRYVGGETPVLNKMGGGDWAKTKGKARRAVRQIAAQLVQLYAARKSSPGHAFGADTPWQREMEDAFPFTETPDQLAAINEVKHDMEQPIPMDRVISGDVGFGKTEIAVRAAFKAVQDGKQVAVLVPTTLLASQHLQTFTDRMRSSRSRCGACPGSPTRPRRPRP
jgi:transcription-repair coupling factor (superfamily II helicase)